MRRLLLATAALAFTVAVGLPLATAGTDRSGGRTQAKAKAKVERKLVGSWRLLSFVVRSAEGLGHPFGQDAVGKLTYTPDGNIWALVARRDPPKNLPDALWYTGTFRVDVKSRTIIHRVRHANIPAWEGSDQLRPFRFRRDQLTLSTPPAEPGGPTLVLTWERERTSSSSDETARSLSASSLSP